MKKSKNIKKIVLIEPGEQEFHLLSYVKMPKIGPPILGRILKELGYDVTIYSEIIGKIDWETVFAADLVGISTFTSVVRSAYRMAERIREKGVPVVMGGSHVTFKAEEALDYCDYVIRGEGEESFPELLDALNMEGDLKHIRGLSYLQDGRKIHNPDRDFITPPFAWPDFSLISGFKERCNSFFVKFLNGGTIPISTSRGCPYECTFCSVIKTFGRKWRAQEPDLVIEEIKHHMDVMKTRSVFFVDDNFALDRNRAKEILKGIIREGLDLDIITQVRAEAARDEELLDLMQKAGVFYVAVGFESVNPKSLKAYKKGLNVEDTFQSIALFHKYGIRVHGMFVVGCDEDDSETIRKTVDYSIQYNLDSVHYLAIMPLPGTELTRSMEERGVIFSNNYDHYNSHYVTYYPNKMRPSTLQKEVALAHKRFYSYENILRSLWRGKGLNHAKFMLIGHFLNAKLNKQQYAYQKKLDQMEERLSPSIHQVDYEPVKSGLSAE